MSELHVLGLHARLQRGVVRQHHLQLLALLAHEALELRDPVVWRHAAMLRLLRKCDGTVTIQDHKYGAYRTSGFSNPA
jgi:hypothetical protein